MSDVDARPDQHMCPPAHRLVGRISRLRSHATRWYMLRCAPLGRDGAQVLVGPVLDPHRDVSHILRHRIVVDKLLVEWNRIARALDAAGRRDHQYHSGDVRLCKYARPAASVCKYMQNDIVGAQQRGHVRGPQSQGSEDAYSAVVQLIEAPPTTRRSSAVRTTSASVSMSCARRCQVQASSGWRILEIVWPCPRASKSVTAISESTLGLFRASTQGRLDPWKLLWSAMLPNG